MSGKTESNTYKREITMTVRRSVSNPNNLVATLVIWHYRNEQPIGMHMHECQVEKSVRAVEHRFAHQLSKVVTVGDIDREQPSNQQPVPTTITWDINIETPGGDGLAH